MINILAVGKKHEDWVEGGIKRYSARLRSPWNIQWILLPHSRLEGNTARLDESKRLLSKLKDDDFVILLDEKGLIFDSPTLSSKIKQQIDSSRRIVVIIGGAYGVTPELEQRADLVWSLSPLVFPHQLVRLVLVEQLYRSQAISLGSPYHHE